MRVNLFMEAEPFRKASSAPGFINGFILEEIRQLGCEVTSYYKHRMSPADMFMPVATADRARRLKSTPPADLAIFCDQGLWIRPPGPQLARQSMVVFHGLIGGQGVWLDNPAVDLYCAPSRYMREVLVSLLTMPDLRHRTCLDPRGFDKVSDFHVGLPCVVNTSRDESTQGAELPEQVLRAVEANDVIGHALQPRKLDWYSVLNILVHLNLMSREEGGPRYRLVVESEDFALIDYSFTHGFPLDVAGPRSILQACGFTLGDLLIPVRFLGRAALFRLFTLAKFGLSYNTCPESFGFYPLESVYQGCPVYTNGIGNNRHGLPPEHGVRVIESVDMAFGDLSAFQEVARAIMSDVRSRESITQACARGREYIARNFNRESFSRTWRACLAQLERAPTEPAPFESLRVLLSPMVRRIDEETGRVVSDFERLTLEPHVIEMMREALGQPVSEVLRGLGDDRLDVLQGLFSQGVLTLRPDGYEIGL